MTVIFHVQETALVIRLARWHNRMEWIFEIGPYTCLIPGIYGLKFMDRLSPFMRWIIYLCWLYLVVELLGKIIRLFNAELSHIAWHFLSPLEVLLIVHAYSYLVNGIVSKKALYTIGLLAAGFCVYDSVVLTPPNGINSYSTGVCFLVIIGMVMLHLFTMVNSDATLSLKRVPEFWVSMGMLSLFGLSFFHYLAYNVMKKEAPEFILIIGYIKAFFITSSYLIFTFAIWVSNRYHKSFSSL